MNGIQNVSSRSRPCESQEIVGQAERDKNEHQKRKAQTTSLHTFVGR